MNERVKIAQDILDRLELKKLKVTTNHLYQRLDTVTEDTVDKIEEVCSVCAKGSILLSYLRLYDGIDMDSFVGQLNSNLITNSDIVDILKDTFTVDQLDMMECAFEASTIVNNLVLRDYEFACKCRNLYYGLSPEDRLKAICYNLIENDGTFVV